MTIFEFARTLAIGIAGLAAFLYYVAHIGEKGVNAVSKDRLRRTFRAATVTPRFRHAFVFFLTASDRYFGARIFSVKAVVRSIALSATWMTAVFFGFSLFDQKYLYWLSRVTDGVYAWKAIALIGTAFFTDFLSVCVTRSFVRLALKKSGVVAIFFVVLNVAFCAMIFYFLFSATRFAIAPHLVPQSPSEALHSWTRPDGPSIVGMSWEAGALDHPEKLSDRIVIFSEDVFKKAKAEGITFFILHWFPESVLFYSNLLTSIWILLYVIGYWLLFFSVRIDRVKRLVERSTNFDNDPFHALAWILLVASVVTSLIGTLIFAVVTTLVS